MTTLAPLYKDASRSPAERAQDLLTRMTLAEKVAQLSAVWGYEVVAGSGTDMDQLRALAAHGVGQITRLAGSTNLRPAQVAGSANDIQRFLINETRLGIPAIVHEECLHGLLAFDAPSFQQSIGAAATFDPELVASVAQTIRQRMRATGARHALAPVLDITRDPRWGRIEETYGEDPYLAAAMGCAYIRGLQDEDLRRGVVATAKHLVGHGMAEGGLNQAPVHIGPRELADEQLVPFEAAVVEAAVGSVMPAYCDVDGLPCHASHELLTGLLRDKWGFAGLVVSDYAGIEMLSSAHRLSGHRSAIARLALEAGVDVELPRRDVYDAPLLAALDDQSLTHEVVDRAVARVLRIKFELGLFEAPYVDEPSERDLADLMDAEVAAGKQLATQSLVLVANDGVLPLAASTSKVAVIGRAAASARDFMGDYSHLVHLETLIESRRTGTAAFGIIDSGRPIAVEDELSGKALLIDELRDRLAPRTITFTPGVGVDGGSEADIEAAAAAARAADVAIVVIAERSGLTRDSTTGEFRDRLDLSAFGLQEQMLEAIVATGTPVVLVVVSGRPLALEWAAAHCAAILLAWVPGDFGPAAIADVLGGIDEPGGRLPVSMPRHVGQVPLNYRHHPTGGRSNPLGDYVEGSAGPLWPFGFGLGYSQFELSNLCVSETSLATHGASVEIKVDVANIGPRPGAEIVQLYVRDVEASVARPVRELRGFGRVALGPGQTSTATFTLHSEQLAYVGADYRRVVEPGKVALMVGRSSADLPLETTLDVVGPTVEVPVRHHTYSLAKVR